MPKKKPNVPCIKSNSIHIFDIDILERFGKFLIMDPPSNLFFNYSLFDEG